MKSFLKALFSDNNHINEKAILGFAAFFMMIIFAITDIVMGILGKSLTINDLIYNSFLIITLGALGIASVDKYINSRDGNYKK